MAGDPVDLAGFGAGLWPFELKVVVKVTMRRFAGQVGSILQAMPVSAAGYRGQLAVCKTDESGITFAGASGLDFIDCAGLPLFNTKVLKRRVTASATLTDAAHNTALLVVDSASALDLTLQPDSAGQNGISDGFNCAILPVGAGTVGMVLAGAIANGHPDGHVHFQAGRLSTILLCDGKVYLSGATAA